VGPSQQVIGQQSSPVFRPDATGFAFASSQQSGGQQSGGQHSPGTSQHPGGQQPSPRLELA
jgi:hypothetical protein